MTANPASVDPPPPPLPRGRPSTGLFERRPRQLVVRDLVDRSRRRLEGLDEAALVDVLEDALYHERKRLERAAPDPDEEEILEALSRAIVRGSRHERVMVAERLVARWADEVHGHFDKRVYGVATRVLPRALTLLLSRRPDRLREWTRTSNSRMVVQGDTALLRELANEATLILAPTHVSNLDSPLIGLALHLGGLPPFVYGAGLNLFHNPVVGWWMHRLGAYTVDRTKRARLYKEVLKDYSVRALTTRHHSLFFPGGTRARSGELETYLKKGLLGTGLEAWQEMLEQADPAGPPPQEVYVVPLTLSFQLVLEGATLIDDHLAEIGRQRHIITDDEFARPRTLATFASRVLDLDASVVAHFGDPLDVLGNPVERDPEARAAQALRRRRYVCDAEGRVERDLQRDRVYTDRLADALVAAYPRYAWAQATHVAAYTAWSLLEEQAGSGDPFRIVRMPSAKRRLRTHDYLARLRQVLDRVRAGAEAGRWHADLPEAEGVLDTALDRFGRYHRTRALVRRGSELVVEDPKLCLYYRNRLTYIDRGASAEGGA